MKNLKYSRHSRCSKSRSKSLKEIEENFDMFLKSPSIDKSDSLAKMKIKKLLKIFMITLIFLKMKI